MASKPAIEIKYCHECGYLPDAVTMADRLLREFSHKVVGLTLTPGEYGTFEVKVDGDLIFSRLDAHRFPTLNELRDSIRARVEAGTPGRAP